MLSSTKFAGPAGPRLCRGAFTGLLLASLAGVTSTQAQPTSTQSIYTCVDARGRKLTSDRPIAECSDREQKLLNANGTLKAVLKPVPTALERLALEAKAKAEQDEKTRINDEKRRDRALLIRYPNQAVHDKERAQALAQIGVLRQAAADQDSELKRVNTRFDNEQGRLKQLWAMQPGVPPTTASRAP